MNNKNIDTSWFKNKQIINIHYDEEVQETINFNEEILYEIEEKIHILGLIHSYFKMTNSNYKINIRPNYHFLTNCCPFHKNGENNYSFSVIDNMHIVYCFGCGYHSRAINLVRNITNLDINSSVKILAKLINKPINTLDKLEEYWYKNFSIYYDEYIDLNSESIYKYNFLEYRIKKYLELNYKNKILTNDEIKQISKRLCCSYELVDELVDKLSYKEKTKKKKLSYFV